MSEYEYMQEGYRNRTSALKIYSKLCVALFPDLGISEENILDMSKESLKEMFLGISNENTKEMYEQSSKRIKYTMRNRRIAKFLVNMFLKFKYGYIPTRTKMNLYVDHEIKCGISLLLIQIGYKEDEVMKLLELIDFYICKRTVSSFPLAILNWNNSGFSHIFLNNMLSTRFNVITFLDNKITLHNSPIIISHLSNIEKNYSLPTPEEIERKIDILINLIADSNGF